MSLLNAPDLAQGSDPSKSSAVLAQPEDVWAMRLALGEAAQAAMLGEVPVGAVIIRDGQVLGAGGNRRECRNL